ncbi:hypothetical protein BGZ61DRAFT_486963 [Ilyonectria robusta]|uniref:uncharacterized protein n=1 Tax=Ilyonectria robusta TaxID=1079257 RepID=UPI001E8D60CB|nr:uncharacterized protein BGZ61DRAFT_486963 [Ilyonectria robusta]KAH8654737.1 hypothetical protein BGZ61DRAFT_486963 [Ilyonectria robusta]
MHLLPPRVSPEPSPQCSAPLIIFRHPEYSIHVSMLLALPPLDVATSEDSTDAISDAARLATNHDLTETHAGDDFAVLERPPRYGIHHGTALVACQIIAGNAFNRAYLTYDRKGQERVTLAPDGLLTRPQYYLQVHGSTQRPYPITPNFQNWQFPHGDLPQPWASLPSPSAATARSCVISTATTVDAAHVIPRSMATWFEENGMAEYSRDSTTPAVDTSRNICPLRCDLHKDFDRRAFAIVPKPVAGGSHALAVHFLTVDDVASQASEFHNQLVQKLDSVAPQYLFSRFAYAVFSLVKIFVLQGEKRWLEVKTLGEDELGASTWMTEVLDMSRDQRNNFFGGGGSRSSSPRKRTRGSTSQNNDDFDGAAFPNTVDEGAASGALGYQSPSEDEEERGRKRLRDWVLHSAGTGASSHFSDEEDIRRKAKRRRTTSAQPSTPSLTTSLGSHSSLEAHEDRGNVETADKVPLIEGDGRKKDSDSTHLVRPESLTLS